jgi:hypothetical protein
MSLYLQYGIVFIAVAAAGWSAWRILRGRRVFGRGAKSVAPDSCAACSSSDSHRKQESGKSPEA